MHQHLPIHMLLWRILRVVRHESRLWSVLKQKSGHVDDDVEISALDAFYEKDGRKNGYIREVLERYRGEDARELKRSESNELVETWTCLNALEWKMWNINPKILMDEKSWKTWKSNQKIVMDEELVQNVVMDEELVQNGVMDEKFVKNFVMDDKIGPKVVMDRSTFKIGGWNILQTSNRKLLEEFMDENEPWLLIGIPSRDSFLMIQHLERHFVSSHQHVKELIPLREGRHVTTQCYTRQHDACLHSTSWRESTRM